MKQSRPTRLRLAFVLIVMPLLLIVGLAATTAQSAPSTHVAGGDLLPDLVTLAPSNLQVTTSRKGGGQRQLRFANTIANVHTGVLELTWATEDCDGDGKARNDRTAYQRIYADAGAGDGVFTRGTDTNSGLRRAGCFDFHPSHHHWHLENFSRYQLWTLSGTTRVGVVGTTDKVSFCVIDSSHPYAGLTGSPTSKYFSTCSRDGDQGLSVGWADTYGAHLDGQHVTTTGLADGTYCLVSTADPENQLVETDEGTTRSGSG